jgi:hypothetical protein
MSKTHVGVVEAFLKSGPLFLGAVSVNSDENQWY